MVTMDPASYVRQLPEGEFWFEWALVAGAAIAAFYYAFRQWRRARLIEDAPTARIRSAPQGYVELEGKGRMMPGEPIYSPLTKKNCLWFRYKIEKRETIRIEGRHASRWRVVERGESDALFFLEDETGRCVVDPEGAEVTALDTLVWYGDTPHPTSVPLLEGGSIGFGGRYRYSETFILEGQPLYALGQFQTVRATEGTTPDQLARDLLRQWKREPERLLEHFDLDKNGTLDPQEWEQVRKLARRKAKQEYDRLGREPDLHLLKKPEDDRHPYLLSAHPQHHLARRYRRFAALYVTLFFILGSLASWSLFIRLNQ